MDGRCVMGLEVAPMFKAPKIELGSDQSWRRMAADREIVVADIMLLGLRSRIGVGSRLPRRATVKDWLGCVEIVGRKREIAGEMPNEADDAIRFHNDLSH